MIRTTYVFRATFDSGDVSEKAILADTLQQAWALIHLNLASHLNLIIKIEKVDEYKADV